MRIPRIPSSPAAELSRFVSNCNLRCRQLPPATDTVLISALRNRTWMDWAVYIAFRLRTRGKRPVIVYSEAEAHAVYGKEFKEALRTIPDAMSCNLDSGKTEAEDRENAEALNYQFVVDSVAYDLHLERQTILDNKSSFEMQLSDYTLVAKTRAGILSNIMRRFQASHFILYSGLIFDTPAFLQLARRLKIPVHCVEGWAWRKGHMIMNTNGPALEYDIRAWQATHGWSDQHEEVVDRYMEFQTNGRKKEAGWLRDFYNVQRTSKLKLPTRIRNFVGDSQRVALLAPNVVGDSSTLNRETIFRGMDDWLNQVLTFYRSNKELKLIIRAHPAESWVRGKIKVKIGELAKSKIRGVQNVLIVEGNDPVNTFAIEPFINLGLVWMSSVGPDLVARGVPVICAASPKYSGLGFAHEPATAEEYFSLLHKFSQLPRGSVTSLNISQARKYIYTVFAGFSFPGHGSDFTCRTLDWDQLDRERQHIDFLDRLSSPSPHSSRVD